MYTLPHTHTSQIIVSEHVEKSELSSTAGGNVKWYSSFSKTVLAVPHKTKQLPREPTILLLVIYTKFMKTHVHTKTYM